MTNHLNNILKYNHLENISYKNTGMQKLTNIMKSNQMVCDFITFDSNRITEYNTIIAIKWKILANNTVQKASILNC